MTPILGQSQVSMDTAMRFAFSRNAPSWYALEVVPLFWAIAPLFGVRPDVACVQSMHETGFAKFGRAVTPEHCNPCGLKVPDPSGLADNDPSAHARFPSWEIGVLAHVEHLALYAGCPGFPRPYKKLSPTEWAGCADPRHFSWIAGRAPSVEELGGNWAPSSTYGNRLVALLDELRGF